MGPWFNNILVYASVIDDYVYAVLNMPCCIVPTEIEAFIGSLQSLK